MFISGKEGERGVAVRGEVGREGETHSTQSTKNTFIF